MDAVELVAVAGDGAVWLARGPTVVRSLAGDRHAHHRPGGLARQAGAAPGPERDHVDRRRRRRGRLAQGRARPADPLPRARRSSARCPTCTRTAQGRSGWAPRARACAWCGGGRRRRHRRRQRACPPAGSCRCWRTTGGGCGSAAARASSRWTSASWRRSPTGGARACTPSVYDGDDGVLMRAEAFGHPAGWKGPDGRLWFATTGGVAVVDLAAPPARPPRVIIERAAPGRPAPRIGGRGQRRCCGPGPRDLQVQLLGPELRPARDHLFPLPASAAAGRRLGRGGPEPEPALPAARPRASTSCRSRPGSATESGATPARTTTARHGLRSCARRFIRSPVPALVRAAPRRWGWACCSPWSTACACARDAGRACRR